MSDDKHKTGEDRQLVSIQEDYERRDWARSMGCSEEQLMQAVAAVGHSADKVRAYLRTEKASS